MARIEVKSAQAGIPSAWVELDGVTEATLQAIHDKFQGLAVEETKISTAVSRAFLLAVDRCPHANPSDLWHHVIYRYFIDRIGNEQRWKRVSGFALEEALCERYRVRLSPYGLRMYVPRQREVKGFLEKLGLASKIKPDKLDTLIEGNWKGVLKPFGAAHIKASLAERIQDDAPASAALMERGVLSVVLTMDVKSFPPPHGDGTNFGELGGRSMVVRKERPKREYVEVDGQFDGMFSFNHSAAAATEPR